ncbi:MAG: nucleoside recognition domain-containing protein [Candidatus Avigastranaerophilus sp.]
MNYIWYFLIVISVVFGAINGTLNEVVNAILSGTQLAVKIILTLLGIMTFWLGIMKIAEKSGIVEFLSKILRPAAKLIFPEIPADSKIIGDVAMNFSANALGLANAATPIGIKAISGMQELNKDKESASDSMCTLLAMNTAGFQLIPATVIAILAANGCENPTEIIVPTLIVTLTAFVGAILTAKIFKHIFPPQIIKEEKDA